MRGAFNIMYGYAKNRRDFDQEAYNKNDASGKQTAEQLILYLNKNQQDIIKKFFGSTKDLTVYKVENKKYGDLLLEFDMTNHQLCEVEVRSSHNFDGNWFKNGNYSSGINIPKKPDLKNSNGIYLSFSQIEVNNFIEKGYLPKRFIIIQTEVIKTCPLEAPPSKNGSPTDIKNNDYKYKVPHEQAYKFEWDDKTEKYLLKK